VYEVFKRILHQQRGEAPALQAIALMHQGSVIDLDATLAIAAARLSLELRIPLADSVMLTTARALGATLWTQDEDFEGQDGVRY
jgi:predicted nucleic acid-binding protein